MEMKINSSSIFLGQRYAVIVEPNSTHHAVLGIEIAVDLISKYSVTFRIHRLGFSKLLYSRSRTKFIILHIYIYVYPHTQDIPTSVCTISTIQVRHQTFFPSFPAPTEFSSSHVPSVPETNFSKKVEKKSWGLGLP